VSAIAPAPTAGWSAITVGELLLLGAIWGASFLFMRIAAPAFGALPLVELRLGFGALVLLPFLWMARHAFQPRLLAALALVGIVNSALPFALFAWAATFAPAGIGANLVRKYLAGALPPAAVAAATLGAAAVFMAPAAALTWPETPPGAGEWAAVVALGVVCTGAAFVLFYRLIRKIGAARAVMVTYLIPLFGAGWAWWLLDEPVTWAMVVAGALILGSIAMSRR
jgi:drug/metabolite transporter (DMT)-like permease